MPFLLHARLARLPGVFALVGLAMCSSLDTFTIEESATTVVQGSLVGQVLGDLGFAGFVGLDLSENQTLQNEGVERSDIDSVFVRSLSLRITDTTQGQSFDFLNSIAFFAESDGLPRVEIASGADFAPGLTEIGLDVSNVNLADYVAAPTLTITTDASGGAPAEDTSIEATLTLDVDVNVAGALCGG
ncbi:MAG: hypothetical protein AAF658_17220 [Myxococcota bacterium]